MVLRSGGLRLNKGQVGHRIAAFGTIAGAREPTDVVGRLYGTVVLSFFWVNSRDRTDCECFAGLEVRELGDG